MKDTLRFSLLLLLLPVFSLHHCLAAALTAADIKLGIVTLASGSSYNLMGRLAHKNHGRFAQLHGFDYIAANDSAYMDPRLPGAWWKCYALQDLLSGYDWLLWMDADTLFCDAQLDLLSYIQEAPPEADMIVAQDIPPSLFNTGVFWMRNSEWSRSFLQRTLARGLLDERVRNHGYYEQLAMQIMYKKSPAVRKKIYVIPDRRRHEFNGYVVDNSFRRQGMGILHDAGCRFRIDAQECQRWYRSYYCMCLPLADDSDCK